MSARSTKVTEFLKNNPEFEKHYKEIYTKTKNLNENDISAVGKEAKSKIEEKLSSPIDLSKMKEFVSITKKLSEDQFLSWAAGDNDNFPAVKLTSAEMALVQGGGKIAGGISAAMGSWGLWGACFDLVIWDSK